jgi:D-glycero-alpha-D-manno-heptose 1-phosphate guanylyltransferase
LVYAIEEKPLGTGGGVVSAFQYALTSDIFVINGDTYFPVDLSLMESMFAFYGADLLMALRKVEEGGRYGTITLGNNNRILSFSEKSETPGISLVNGGIYLMKRPLLYGSDFPEKFSIEHDFFEKFVDRLQFYGIAFDEEFIDIGIPETYFFANNQLFRN